MVAILSVNCQTILVGLCIGILVYNVTRRLKYRLPPGPWCVPIIGNVQVYSSLDPCRKVSKMVDRYGPVIRISFGQTEMCQHVGYWLTDAGEPLIGIPKTI
ncbi:uncharacterized protein LOC144618825 [Crassostrea virginica]